MRNLVCVWISVLGLSAASCTDKPEMPAAVADLCEVEGQRMMEALQGGRRLEGEELGFAMRAMSDEIDPSEVRVGRDKFVPEGSSGESEFGYFYSSTRYEGLQTRYFVSDGLICKFISPTNDFLGVAAFIERDNGKVFYAFPDGPKNKLFLVEID